jgi:hypothetical protein
MKRCLFKLFFLIKEHLSHEAAGTSGRLLSTGCGTNRG